MNHLPTGLFLATAVAAAFVLGALPIASAQTGLADAPVRFGMDASAVANQKANGVAPDYGTFWVGPWTLSSGWAGPDGQLTALKAAGVTPAIHFYYWGDDISPACVEDGCWSSLHNAQKTRAGWEALGAQLTDHLNAKMGGGPAVIFLESEFNKGGISSYEPFDGYMAAMAGRIHAAYPNAVVVLGFGNWDNGKWGNFDRAAAASDMVGLQGMRGSTKDTATAYDSIYEGTLAGVQKLDALFDKPIMLTDIALSSYPEPAYLAKQSGNLDQVFENLDVLKGHGVEAMVYRSWKDSPGMDLANYYGEAERHWGLAWAGNGTLKAAGHVWVDGVKAERADAAPVNHAPTAAFAATGSNLLVGVDASASTDPDGDAITYAWAFGDGATGTGRTASHTYAASGSYTVGLVVSDGALTASASKAVTVTKPATTTSTTTTTTAATPTTASGHKATVTPSSSSNEWWVQVGVSPVPAKVDLKVGSGAFVAMDKQPYGFTKNTHVAKGTMVQFRVTSTGGQTATTPAQAWLVDMSAKTATASGSTTTTSQSTTTTAFKASFTPKSVGNDWWVETATSANAPVAKVEAKVNDGAYVALPKTDWGTYAKSINAPNGSLVTFRATSAAGATSTGTAIRWP